MKKNHMRGACVLMFTQAYRALPLFSFSSCAVFTSRNLMKSKEEEHSALPASAMCRDSAVSTSEEAQGPAQKMDCHATSAPASSCQRSQRHGCFFCGVRGCLQISTFSFTKRGPFSNTSTFSLRRPQYLPKSRKFYRCVARLQQ